MIYVVLSYILYRIINLLVITNIYKDKINKSYKYFFISCLFTVIICLTFNYLGFYNFLYYIVLISYGSSFKHNFYDDFYSILNSKSEHEYVSEWTKVFGNADPGLILPYYLPDIPKPWEIPQFFDIDKMRELHFMMGYEYNLRKMNNPEHESALMSSSILKYQTVLIRNDIRKSEILARVKELEKLIREESDFGT